MGKIGVVVERKNGQSTWTGQDGDLYLVTGVTRSGKRFRLKYSSWRMANCINLYNGSVWLLRDGKRHLIDRVYN